MERIAFAMKVREGQEEEYIRRHKEVWLEVLADMDKAGLHRMRNLHAGPQTLPVYGS